MNEEILVVDDEPDIRSLISLTLEDEGFVTVQAANAQEARSVISSRPPSCIILDIWMRDSDMDGIDILKWVQDLYPEVPVLMISGHGTIETAVQALRFGAHDFIEKPFKTERLLLTVRRALQQSRLSRENAELKARTGQAGPRDLIGQSSAVKQLQQAIDRVAPTASRVLITGPSGSGKEMAARLIHDRSDRREGPFIVASCARLNTAHADRDLFGSEGLQSGRRVIGLFEQAHRGTLYFDEVCELPAAIQSRLVRTVAEQNFRRVGGNTEVSTDVRVISASSQDLQAAIADDVLREDLYYRLGVISLSVAPLSSRREDIGALARHFVSEFADQLGCPPVKLGEDLLNAMRAYRWPGSVRQLRNVIETLMILADKSSDEPLGVQALPQEILSGSEQEVRSVLEKSLSLPLREAREEFEREYMRLQLDKFGGNISQMAKFVGMERSALHRKLKSLGLQAS
ncbi:MAG: sigma-54-dependent transcriptional regulator [Candidatus Puniceispirillaceae bacterium]|nr:sigma-54-dependent Fis family transcriptional regulator [Euryarchaeota archaeon]HCD63226.1 sigma-54-dependent Fis family transcriptional regulator [Alphaproteobacteria bacterium]